jgi:phosphodiesterase/alkaline phosphatase D-like protein
VTLAASSVTTSAATMSGQVNPSGSPTVYTFEYGPSLAFGAISSVIALDEANAFEPVSAALSGLAANTTYYYRVIAANAAGSSSATVKQFTTGPPA